LFHANRLWGLIENLLLPVFFREREQQSVMPGQCCGRELGLGLVLL
jgi:hypothetical protein